METLFIGTVSMFNSKDVQPNVHGLLPLIIEPICGPCPYKRVIDGSVARNMGIMEGNTYMFKFTQLEDDPTYGAQYAFTKIAQPDVLQIMQAQTMLGNSRFVGKTVEKDIEG